MKHCGRTWPIRSPFTSDWRQLPIGRTTNQTTFIIPGRPVGYRLVARPGRRFQGTPVRHRLTVLIR